MAFRRGDFVFWAASGALIISLVVTFGRVGGFDGPVLDDTHNLILNPHVGSLSWDNVRWALTPRFDYVPRYMPIGWLGVDLEMGITGLDPGRLRLFGLGVHIVVSLMLACVLRRALILAGAIDEPQAALAAMLGASVYALHPLRVESLGWESGVIWHQALFFLVVAAWVRLGQRRRPWVEAGAYALSLLSYPVALGVAPAVTVVDARRLGWGAALRRNGLLLAVAVICGAISFAGARRGANAFAAPFPLGLRILQFAAVEGHFVIRTIVPLSLTPMAKPFHSLLVLDPLETVGFCAFALIWIASLTKRGRYILPWVAAGTLLVAPFTWVTNWLNPDVGDRYSAPLHLLVAFAIALSLARAKPKWIALFPVVAALIVFWAILGAKQILYWKNDGILFSQLERNLDPADPDFPSYFSIMHLHVVEYYFDNGEFDRAGEEVSRVLAVAPFGSAALHLSAVIEDAKAAVARAVLSRGNPPPIPKAYEQRKLVVEALQKGDGREAELHLQEIRRVAPGYYGALVGK